jgi:hypothetical protein
VRGSPVVFNDFSGGLDTKSAPYLVQNKFARDCRNVVTTLNGAIKKRAGNQTFASVFAGTPTVLTSLFGMQATTVLIATGAAKMYSISTGGVSTDITGASVLTSGTRWHFAEAPASGGQGPLYAVNGTDIPKQWTGAGSIADWTATTGAVPNGKFILYVKNRVLIAGVPGTPHRLYASALGDPRNWGTAANQGWVVDLDPNDGDQITGIGVVGPYVMVFKNEKAFTVYDLDTGANRRLSTNVGCAAHRSIAESPQGLFFLTPDRGVYATDGVNLRKVSDRITPTLDAVTASARANAAGVFLNDHYYLSVSTGGATNNLTLDYDFNAGSWWAHSNAANQWATWRPAGGLELYAVQAAAAVVDKSYVPGLLQDNGVNFTAYWRSPWIAFQEPYVRKRVRQMHMDGRGVVDVYVSRDFRSGDELLGASVFQLPIPTSFGDATTTFGGTGVFGDAASQDQRVFPTLGVGRSFSVLVQGASNNDLEVDSMSLFIQRRKD